MPQRPAQQVQLPKCHQVVVVVVAVELQGRLIRLQGCLPICRRCVGSVQHTLAALKLLPLPLLLLPRSRLPPPLQLASQSFSQALASPLLPPVLLLLQGGRC